MTIMEPLADRVARAAAAVTRRYQRLVLLVGSPNSGKTAALLALTDRPGFRYVNVSVELGRLLLDLSERQRRLQVAALFATLCGATAGDEVVLLDNLEILFARSLAQEPLRLLERVSRNGTLVAAWRGTIIDGALCFASPDHPEYRRELIGDHLIVLAGDTATV
jgi:predicted ATPase